MRVRLLGRFCDVAVHFSDSVLTGRLVICEIQIVGLLDIKADLQLIPCSESLNSSVHFVQELGIRDVCAYGAAIKCKPPFGATFEDR